MSDLNGEPGRSGAGGVWWRALAVYALLSVTQVLASLPLLDSSGLAVMGYESSDPPPTALRILAFAPVVFALGLLLWSFIAARQAQIDAAPGEPPPNAVTSAVMIAAGVFLLTCGGPCVAAANSAAFNDQAVGPASSQSVLP